MRRLLFIFCSFSIGLTAKAQILPVEYKREFEGDSILVFVKNKLPAPISYQLTCDTVGVQLDTLLQSNADFIEVLKMPNLLENDSASLSPFVKVSAQIGDPTAIHDDDYQYKLPFEQGKSYRLIQGFNGRFSHQSEHSRYALDFKMKIGEPIHAARGGVVCYFQKRFSEGGRDREKYVSRANRIMIMHEDGTIATYTHLKKDGVVVEVGQMVKAGELIGFSGNTGFTTTPHLHFVVRSGEQSVKFKMGTRKKLKAGRKYSH